MTTTLSLRETGNLGVAMQPLNCFLCESDVDPKIVDFMMKSMHINSISSFAARWENADHFGEDVVAHVEPFKSDLSAPAARLQIACLGTAWQKAQAMASQASHASQASQASANSRGREGKRPLDSIFLDSKVLVQMQSADGDSSSPLIDAPNQVVGILETETTETVEGYASSKWLVRLSCIGLFLYWCTGYVYGMYRRGWDFIDSFYFVAVTISTVGYGDETFRLHDDVDKLFGAMYVFVGVVIIGVALGVVVEALEAKAEERIQQLHDSYHHGDLDVGDAPTFNLKAERWRVIRDILWSFTLIGITLAIGTAVMMLLERDWSTSDAFYFCMITVTTVGYGDLLPTNSSAKLFVTFYILFGFSVLAQSLSAVGAVPFRIRQLRKVERSLSLLKESLDEKQLASVCSCREVTKIRSRSQIAKSQNAPYIDRSEFVLWQLLKQDKVQMVDVQRCLNVFDKVDLDGSGRLDQADLDLYISQKASRFFRSKQQL